jgi:CheY-like chemotaxis protein
VLDAADVLPMALEAYAPARAAAPITGAAPALRVSPPRALVAEDSIATRALLTRSLSDRGFEVHAVERAEQLDRVLDIGPWAIVLLDVDLPDASGRAYLRAANDRLARHDPPPIVVALVRDREDDAEAGAAGIRERLLKPVDRDRLRRWIDRAAAEGSGAR